MTFERPITDKLGVTKGMLVAVLPSETVAVPLSRITTVKRNSVAVSVVFMDGEHGATLTLTGNWSDTAFDDLLMFVGGAQ